MSQVSWQILRCASITLFAGISWPFVCGMLFLQFGDDALLRQIQLLQTLGIHSGGSLKAVIQISDAILWAVVFGILFGVPLAIFVRQNVLRYWWLFFVPVFLLVAEGEIVNERGVIDFISELALSQFPVYHAFILIVWIVTARKLSHTKMD